MINKVTEFVKNNKVGVIVGIFTLMVAASALLIFSKIVEKI